MNQALEAAKEESLRQHQLMQIAMKKQRAFIVESMEMAKKRRDWSKAREIVNMAVSSVRSTGVLILFSSVTPSLVVIDLYCCVCMGAVCVRCVCAVCVRCVCGVLVYAGGTLSHLVTAGGGSVSAVQSSANQQGACTLACRLYLARRRVLLLLPLPSPSSPSAAYPRLLCTLSLQSLPEISRRNAGLDDMDEYAAQRTAKAYADKAAKMEADMAARRTQPGPETDLRSSGGGGGDFKSPYELVNLERKKPRDKAVTGVPAFAHVSGGVL